MHQRPNAEVISARALRAGCAALVLAGALAGPLVGAAATGATAYAGRPLSEVLRALQAAGLRIVFTSHLISPQMRVESEPRASEPREILGEILRPHGLGLRPGPGDRLIVVRPLGEASGTVWGTVRSRATGEALSGIDVVAVGTGHSTRSDAGGRFELSGLAAGRHTLEARGPALLTQRRERLQVAAGSTVEVSFELELSTIASEEILVTPQRLSADTPELRQQPPARDVEAAIHLDQDVLQSISSLPGLSGSDDSAQFSIRGGRPDEVLILLDGLEVIEPFHMKDFGSSRSLVTPTSVGAVEVTSGGFGAQHGDRMSGVLEMTSVRPGRALGAHISIGEEGFQAGASGTFLEQRGRWLAAGRDAEPQVPAETGEQQQEARFWDGFAKLELQLTRRQDLRAHRLEASDDYSFIAPVAEPSDFVSSDLFSTDYVDTYSWLTHQAVLGRDLSLTTTASFGDLLRDRSGRKNPRSADFLILDQRDVRRVGLRQDWHFELDASRQLDGGFDVRRYRVTNLYQNVRPSTFDPGSTFPPQDQLFGGTFEGELGGAYLSARWRPRASLTLDAGLRFDHTTFADDERLSPRLNLSAALGPTTILRAAWGYFHQSQRPYELQVPDGETTFAASESSEQRSLGVERALGGGFTLQIDAYWRRISQPRATYENLFKPVSRFPEIETDRVLFAPSERRAYGLEATLRGAHSRLDWQLSYVHARVIDTLRGVDAPGRFDRPHSLRLDAAYRTPWKWDLRLIWTGYSGRPTTPLAGKATVDADGGLSFEPVFGAFNSNRLPTYHRLDLQAHRRWSLWRLQLDAYLGIENLYDHDNVRGLSTDFVFDLAPSGEVTVAAEPELGRGRSASFGIRLGF